VDSPRVRLSSTCPACIECRRSCETRRLSRAPFRSTTCLHRASHKTPAIPAKPNPNSTCTFKHRSTTSNSAIAERSRCRVQVKSNVRCSSWAHWKPVVDFLLVIFLLGILAEALRTIIDWKSPFWKGWVNLAQNFRWNGTSSTKHSSCRKTKWIDLSNGIRMWALHRPADNRAVIHLCEILHCVNREENTKEY